jgi:cytochrome P450
MRALATDPALGATPAEFLIGRARERVRGATGQAPPGVAPGFEAFLREQVFTVNPPHHAGFRQVITRRLTPREMRGMAEHAERVLGGVLDEAEAAGGPVDLARDIAAPYAARFWADRLGMPAASAARVQQLVHEMNGLFLFAPTAEDRTRVLAATEEYMDLVGRAVTRAWERGDNALLDGIARELTELGELDGSVGPRDLGEVVAANHFDGFHTAGIAVANAAHCLLSDPSAVERVRGDPSLAAAAFTEGTRVAAPLMMTTRMALDDVEHDGLRIPTGTPVTMVWIAGNRDPEVFDEPGRFRLDREPRPGTTFGGGARICPGRSATRMLGEVALRALTAPAVEVRLDDPGTGWVPGSAIRHRGASTVAVRRAAVA